MKTLGQALSQLIKDLGIESEIIHNQAVQLWPEVVGKKIANITQAKKIDGKILFVKVKNDSWRNELVFLKKDIIERLNKKIGKKVVEDLRLY
jgi:predicted nucleic acid-binding Zn ribbon protein